MNPSKRLIVFEEKNKHIDGDGNRRITALKILETPDLIQDHKFHAKFKKLSKSIGSKKIDEVECVKIPKKYVKLLKLHGSINWVAEVKNNGKKEVGVITKGWKFKKAIYSKIVMMPPKMIKPEIWDKVSIPPQGINKFGNNAVIGFYPEIWKEAQKQLELCRRIVFIGYSFPPADFAVGNMLRRAISRMKVVMQKSPEIDIIDPNAPGLAERFEQSFKIKVSTANQYLSLQNYLASTRPR